MILWPALIAREGSMVGVRWSPAVIFASVAIARLVWGTLAPAHGIDAKVRQVAGLLPLHFAVVCMGDGNGGVWDTDWATLH